MSGIPAGAGSLLGKRLGKYEILALLALGGTAEIYLARIGGAAGFEKYVVVKCLHDHLADDEDFVKMFLDEARLAAMLDHSNIVQTFELGEYDNRYYMVMEFLAGLSLAMCVRRAAERLPGGKIPVPLVLNIAAQACAGLHYAHERTANGKPLNMVHRDISPQNLVISFEGVVKVVDFGIARAELRETKTKAGTIKGKFAYMSPEQCVAHNVDRRTDVFALGVIIHELLTGRRLFKRTSPYETYQAVIDCAVPPPSTLNHELDPALDEVVMKSLAKDKDQRYPTAEAFGDAMLGYLHHRGKASGPGELGRWFDQYFAQEIGEHGERMRELIAGRELADKEAMGWDEDDDDPAKRASETVDLSGGMGDSVSLDTADLVEVRPSEASLEQVVSRLGTSDADEDIRSDDDEIPAEKTRIESNPLDKLKELDSTIEKRAGKTPAPARVAPGGKTPIPSISRPGQGRGPSGPGGPGGAPSKPSSPTIAARPPRASAPQAAASGGATPVPQGSVTGGPAPLPAPPVVGPAVGAAPQPRGSGKFPDAANLPTMVAEEAAPELARTQLAGQPLDVGTAQTMASLPQPPSVPPQRPSQAGPAGPGAYSETHVAVQPGPGNAASPAGPGSSPGGPGGPPGGPVPSGGAAYPGGPTPPAGAPPVVPTPPGGSPYPVLQGGRPFSADLAPSNMSPMQRPSLAPTSDRFDMQKAANMMSPVGEQYPNAVDWDAQAARRAKALPPWMLPVLFVAALGIALTLTLVIAKILR